jgi:hypothetical protein
MDPAVTSLAGVWTTTVLVQAESMSSTMPRATQVSDGVGDTGEDPLFITSEQLGR